MSGEGTNRLTLKRVALCALGIFFVSLGIAITASSDLGTSPISSLAWVAHRVSQISPLLPEITFGTTSFALNVIFFLTQWAILRRDFDRTQFLQLPCTVLFGVAIDFCMFLCGFFPVASYPGRVAEVVVGCAVVALGLTCEFAAEVLYLPGDGMVKTLSRVLGMKIGPTKIAFDVFLVVASVVLSLAFIGRCVGVREGALISMFAVGFFVRLCQPVVDRLKRIVC